MGVHVSDRAWSKYRSIIEIAFKMGHTLGFMEGIKSEREDETMGCPYCYGTNVVAGEAEVDTDVIGRMPARLLLWLCKDCGADWERTGEVKP